MTAGFLYLVAVMDWASRHVLAWRLSNTMDTGFCIEALEAALRTGTPEIFNTDQGAQFTSAAFTERVLAAGARCSMDGRGRCLDNVFIERLWRSLKYEAVYLHELADGFEAEIGTWMTFYSDVRPHSALGGPHAGRGLRRGACSVNMSAACSALDALDRRMVQVTPLGIQGEGCRLGEKTHRVLDRRPGADKPSPSGGAASVPSPLRYGATRRGKPPKAAPFVHACSASSRGSTSSTTAENTLGTSPPESCSVSDRRRSAARGAREIRSRQIRSQWLVT